MLVTRRPAGQRGVRLRRGPVAVGVVALVVVAAVFAVAARARTPAEIAARARPPAPSVITVPVEVRRLDRVITTDCTLLPASRTTVQLQAPSGASAAVLTALPHPAGSSIAEGDVVVGVSARPVFALAGTIPAFRDLRPGARGEDVTQLQKALERLDLLARAFVTGTYDRRTASAVEKLYDRAGYPPMRTSDDLDARTRSATRGVDDAETALASATDPADRVRARRDLEEARATLDDLLTREGSVVPAGEVLFAPRLPAVLELGGLSLGSVLSNDPMPIALISAQLAAQCAVPSGLVSDVVIGGSAVLAAPSGDVEATVGSLITVDGQVMAVLPLPPGTTTTTDDVVQVTIAAGSAPQAMPVVPVSALWERPGGATVVRRVQPDGGTQDVPVDVVFDADGLVAVRSPLLAANDEVVIGNG